MFQIDTLPITTTTTTTKGMQLRLPRRMRTLLSYSILAIFLYSVSYDLSIIFEYSYDANGSTRRSLQGYRRAEVTGNLDNFENTWEPLKDGETPVFWDIPESGGNYIKKYLGSCYGKVLASELGKQVQNTTETELRVVKNQGEHSFINVDTTTSQGIRRAKEMNFTNNDMVDVTISPLLYEVGELFSQERQGRVFALFRNPIDRTVRIFDHLRSQSDTVKGMTLKEYVMSHLIEDNYITRTLINKPYGKLTEDDVKKASQIMNTKILVGMVSKKYASLDRFEKYFNWRFHDNEAQEECRKSLVTIDVNDSDRPTKIPDLGTSTHDLILDKNKYDMRLYAYVEKLFDEQNAFVSHKQDDYRFFRGNGV